MTEIMKSRHRNVFVAYDVFALLNAEDPEDVENEWREKLLAAIRDAMHVCHRMPMWGQFRGKSEAEQRAHVETYIRDQREAEEAVRKRDGEVPPQLPFSDFEGEGRFHLVDIGLRVLHDDIARDAQFANTSNKHLSAMCRHVNKLARIRGNRLLRLHPWLPCCPRCSGARQCRCHEDYLTSSGGFSVLARYQWPFTPDESRDRLEGPSLSEEFPDRTKAGAHLQTTSVDVWTSVDECGRACLSVSECGAPHCTTFC